MLGGYKITDEVVVDGVVVGHTESSSDFRVGKHCTGQTYNGKTVAGFSLCPDPSNFDCPNITITDKVGDGGQFMFSANGVASLDDWEKLFEDTLHHVRRLKDGHEL